jgi:type IV pilus assembly protein PilM
MPSLLPKSTIQVRPRIAVEVRQEGVYAARANDAAGLLAQVASASLPAGAVVPSLRAGNIVDRIAVIAALKKVLPAVQLGKGRDVTLIVPDTAVRVLLLDFDEIPSKAEDALSVLRFRLAKLLPFNPELAQVSYQVMSRHSLVLQVLVVAIPNEVLAEYESAVREAGFEPGAVLPSTVAVAAALDEVGSSAALLVNGSEFAVTTAILRRGELLLHRTLELKAHAMAQVAALVAQEPANIAIDAEMARTYESAAAEASEVAVAEMVQASVLADAHDPERAELELLQSISVAAAYFEDSLAIAPEEVLTAGTLSSEALGPLLIDTGLRARDVLQSTDLLTTTTIPRGLLAGLRGALKS